MAQDNDIKVGDTIICINAGMVPGAIHTPPPLKLNGEYILQAINVCACGTTTYDIGIAHPIKGVLYCNGCSRETSNEPIWWCATERFVKKQSGKNTESETKSKEERIKEAVATENYELASELNKQ